MDSARVQRIFAAAAVELAAHEQSLNEIDAETGDGDHGFAAAKIARVLLAESQKPPRERVEDYFDDLCIALLRLNGGSAGNLWGVMMEGIGSMYPPPEERADLRTCVCRSLRGALGGIAEISRAKPGEKTLVDPLCAALEAAEREPAADPGAYLLAVAEAARTGADATAGMVARYGRAKNLHENSLGHRDPGAVSLAIMLQALCRAAMEEWNGG